LKALQKSRSRDFEMLDQRAEPFNVVTLWSKICEKMCAAYSSSALAGGESCSAASETQCLFKDI
jgi:hypothetical protein